MFISAAKLRSFDEMPSASAIAASLADWMISPRRRSSALTRLWMGANMLEVRDGAPPRRHAFSLMMNSSSRLSLPWVISSKMISAVMSLARLDGGVGVSAPFSNNTVPVAASIRMA